MSNESKKPGEGRVMDFSKSEPKPGDPDYDAEYAHKPGNMAECLCFNCMQDKNEFSDPNLIGG